MWFNFLQITMICLIVLNILAWCVSWKKNAVTKFAKIGNIVNCGLVILAYLFFISLFLTHQYQFQAVYQNTNNQMPGLLLLSSSWAGQAGSLFLWLTMHSLTLLIALQYKKYQAFISPILLLNQSVIIFLLFKAQPFLKTPVAFRDGIGLNPVLSHINMSIHPPLAFIGYALISFLFAFAISHLLHPIDLEWLIKVKKWVYCAFFCLSSTIILGSLWAYSVLGWGGLWAFDPIENASLVTWLLLLVLIHQITWFQKQKIAPHFSLLLIILTLASVYHMVMLLRSGLMEKLTQHAYLGEKLLTVLIIVDLVYFLIPLFLFFSRYKQIETDHDKEYYTSTPYIKFLISFFLLCLAGLLFLQINQPLIQNFTSYSLPPLSGWFYPLFYLGVLGFLITNQIPFLKNLFQRNRHKIQLVSYSVTSLLLSILLTFVLVILSGNVLTSISMPIVFVFLSCLWIVESVQVQKKDSVKDLVDRITHVAISLMIISFTLSSTASVSQSLFLLPSDSVTIEESTITAKESSLRKKAYIGERETYSIEIKTPDNQYYAYPSLWDYERKSIRTQMKIPFIQPIGFYDMQVIPKQKNQIEFLSNDLIHFKNAELVIENRIQSQNNNQEKLQLVSADLIIKRLNIQSDHIDPYLTEVLHLTREVSPSGIRYKTTPAYSELLESELHWILSDTDSILVQSADWKNGIQVDLVKKPFVIGIRLSYFLFLLLVLIRILFFRYKSWGKQYLFPAYHHTLRRKRYYN